MNRERAVACHCLLIETDSDGLVLVDTGLGTADLQHPDQSLGAAWVAYAQPELNPEESALRQIVRLGYAPQDVRHIVLTHLHRDHTTGEESVFQPRAIRWAGRLLRSPAGAEAVGSSQWERTASTGRGRVSARCRSQTPSEDTDVAGEYAAVPGRAR
ncbi:MBL fold metallo-hydrolase [Streptomyces malaysiense]|uniref:Metallo-beta-lactamase domain-containing protein n=1 Tax=Streptomyces malaysiense TaxID=1428626 RepID=A0A1J4PX40_9ACTN|nr:MBL fold metallo-hydrolase [Streptomyces malaysiense]OIK25501.1 hypothetical protein VT52_021845 [Streptomyces malaysiense]